MATITVAGGIWFLQHYKEFVNPTGGQQPSLTLSSLLSPPPTKSAPVKGPPTEGGPSLPQEIQRAMQSASPQNLGNLPSEQGKRKAVYQGGPIYNKGPVKVYFIFWGDEWHDSGLKASKAQIMNAVQRLFSSQYFDGLQQYGISRPLIGGVVDNLTYPVPEGDIDQFATPKVILDSIAKGTVPSPDPPNDKFKMYHFVWLPPGHAVPGYGGLTTSWTTPKGTQFMWSGVVYPSQPHPLIPDMVDNITQAFGHELVDAFTNAYPPGGYAVMPCTDIPGDPHTYPWDPKACNIEQWCGHILKKTPATGNVMVEAYYSNKDNRCIIPGTPLFTGDAKY